MGFRGLWNISFGFFGIQIGFALQNANMSRIFQSLGTSIDDLPALWVAAPLTGLLVQPVIGHMSDRTWLGRFGRRRPYFLAGALFAALSLLVMPLAPALLFAAVMLWVLDASLNVSMEPFRAFVGDMLGKDQHSAGYAVQTLSSGQARVVDRSFLTRLEQWGVSNVAPEWRHTGHGSLRLLVRRRGAASRRSLDGRDHKGSSAPSRWRNSRKPARTKHAPTVRGARRPGGSRSSAGWIVAGALVVLAVAQMDLEKEVYLLGGLLILYGLASIVAIGDGTPRRHSMLCSIVGRLCRDGRTS
jgi:maltose/moltooligosaccharide transporter